MKIYKVSQNSNNDYDTYDSFVCAAESEENARNMTPDGSKMDGPYSSWVRSPEKVHVELIGRAEIGITEGVILASFNAG